MRHHCFGNGKSPKAKEGGQLLEAEKKWGKGFSSTATRKKIALPTHDFSLRTFLSFCSQNCKILTCVDLNH